MSRKDPVTLMFILIIVLSILFALVILITESNKRVLYLATTTSVKDTGLLDVIIPKFEEYMKLRGVLLDIKYVAVGSGQALKMGMRGDVDILIVHAPSLEKEFMKKGYGLCREVIAYNFFVIVGPSEDPANIAGTNDVVEAFKKIFEAGIKGKARFVSRGDLSGTNVREMEIWNKAKLDPKPYSGKWYIETGKGMGDTLLVAEDKEAYTLTDIGTWLRFKNKLPHLKLFISKSPQLINVYSVIITNATRELNISILFTKFLLSEGQHIIAKYGKSEYGEPLFLPITKAGSKELKWMSEIGALFTSESCQILSSP